MNIQTADLCDDNKEKEIQVLSAKFKNYGGLKKFSGQIVTVKLDKSKKRWTNNCDRLFKKYY